jgi:hypothetical protein
LRIGAAAQLTGMPQTVQMRHRLAHGKRGLVQIQWALEQHGQHIVGAASALGASFKHLIQPVLVVRMQLRNALVQTDKRLAMR